MPIIVFQHWDAGGPGRLGLTLRDHGFRLDIRRPDRGGPAAIPPDLDDVQGVVSLGGPQNVTDEASHPWMQAEAAYLRAAHAGSLPVIGVCLGCQLIAHALGGTVAPMPRPEVGFCPVSLSAAGQLDPILAGVPWRHGQLQSHTQQVSAMPGNVGATVLATSENCGVQAFRAGLRTYGFQFHLECDRSMAEDLLRRSGDELRSAGLGLAEANAAVEREYARYALICDRICVNLTTYALSPFVAAAG